MGSSSSNTGFLHTTVIGLSDASGFMNSVLEGVGRSGSNQFITREKIIQHTHPHKQKDVTPKTIIVTHIFSRPAQFIFLFLFFFFFTHGLDLALHKPIGQ
jgi:hypothetical protein